MVDKRLISLDDIILRTIWYSSSDEARADFKHLYIVYPSLSHLNQGQINLMYQSHMSRFIFFAFFVITVRAHQPSFTDFQKVIRRIGDVCSNPHLVIEICGKGTTWVETQCVIQTDAPTIEPTSQPSKTPTVNPCDPSWCTCGTDCGVCGYGCGDGILSKDCKVCRQWKRSIGLSPLGFYKSWTDWIVNHTATCDGEPNSGAVFDACGVCDGNNSTCLDSCGVPNGNSLSCLDACGVPNGRNETCLDCNGTPHGIAKVDECGVCQGDGFTCRVEQWKNPNLNSYYSQLPYYCYPADQKTYGLRMNLPHIPGYEQSKDVSYGQCKTLCLQNSNCSLYKEYNNFHFGIHTCSLYILPSEDITCSINFHNDPAMQFYFLTSRVQEWRKMNYNCVLEGASDTGPPAPCPNKQGGQ